MHVFFIFKDVQSIQFHSDILGVHNVKFFEESEHARRIARSRCNRVSDDERYFFFGKSFSVFVRKSPFCFITWQRDRGCIRNPEDVVFFFEFLADRLVRIEGKVRLTCLSADGSDVSVCRLTGHLKDLSYEGSSDLFGSRCMGHLTNVNPQDN